MTTSYRDTHASWFARWPSALGPILATRDARGLTRLAFDGANGDAGDPPDHAHEPEGFDDVRRQLDAYFDGRRRRFSLSLAPTGTTFQRRVWAALATIPFGDTVSYGALTRRLGLPPGTARAVGAANARNPLVIVVPCHRVIGASGDLIGYAGGLDRKRHLLALEGATLADQPSLPL